jgi:AraC family transcriptional regulator
LYRRPINQREKRSRHLRKGVENHFTEEEVMSEAITTRSQKDQPVLQIKRRIRHEEISSVLGEMLPEVYEYAIQSGAEFAGPPFCAYREWTPGGVTVEAGLPVTAPVDWKGEIESATIPGGTYAVALHEGAHDSLDKTHALLDSWIEEQGRTADSARYEVYLTDPGQYPDPNEWRTEISCRLE